MQDHDEGTGISQAGISGTGGNLDLTHQYMTPAEVSAYVRLAVQTLAKLRVTGGGPSYVKPRRRILYKRADVQAWLDARVRTSTSDTGK
jgi:molybdenum cofactor biosynthesis enzyme MoaA